MPERNTALNIGTVAGWAGARGDISASVARRRIGDVWTDSRRIRKGDLFVALRTDNDDGHRYVTEALDKGAVAAVVSAKQVHGYPARVRGRLLGVGDPLRAIQKVARSYRRKLGIPCIAITGSNGKTTTRTFVSSVLRQVMSVSETKENWNNHIGVPLSILRCRAGEDVLVLEMGANHEGEIGELSAVARPDVGLITNIGYAHIGLFGSLTATTRAKFEITRGMRKGKGLLLLNGDDTRLVGESCRHDYRTVLYGMSRRCDVRATNVVLDAEGRRRFVCNGREFVLRMPGRHFIYSALPALYLGMHFGADVETVRDALADMAPAALRGEIEWENNLRFVVDCYNANPSSMDSALALLREIAPASRRVAIVGDMLELGSHERRLHRRLGKRLAESGVRSLVAVGAASEHVASGALGAGMNPRRVVTAQNADEALEPARALLRPGDTVLLKGSRGIHLEKLYERLKG